MTRQEFRQARKSMGLSQAKLGEALGMSRGGIKTLEYGISPIRTIHIYAMKWLLQEHQTAKVASYSEDQP